MTIAARKEKKSPSMGQGIVLLDKTVEKRIGLKFVEGEASERNQFRILESVPESKIKITYVSFSNARIARQANGFLRKEIKKDGTELKWKLRVFNNWLLIKKDPITQEEKTIIISTLERMTIFETPLR